MKIFNVFNFHKITQAVKAHVATGLLSTVTPENPMVSATYILFWTNGGTCFGVVTFISLENLLGQN